MHHRYTRRAADERFGVELVLFGGGQVAPHPLFEECAEGCLLMQGRGEAAGEKQVGAAVLSEFRGLKHEAEGFTLAVRRLGFLERSHIHADGLAVILGVCFEWGGGSSC